MHNLPLRGWNIAVQLGVPQLVRAKLAFEISDASRGHKWPLFHGVL